MTYSTHKRIAVILTLVVLAGCAANPRGVIFNENSPTMESILQGNVKSNLTYTDKAHRRGDARAHNGTVNPNQNVFRELDNPTLFLYIEPHVTSGGTYVPGMTVPFKQYHKVEFALPGER